MEINGKVREKLKRFSAENGAEVEIRLNSRVKEVPLNLYLRVVQRCFLEMAELSRQTLNSPEPLK
jgi:hypothetical protein